jgi:general secretion pathway protein B
MSFILDAIAKSEQERQRHEVPGPQVLALPSGTVPQSRSLLPYVVVGALVLNAAVLGVWMQSRQPLPDSPPPRADAGLQAEVAAPEKHPAPAAQTVTVEIKAAADATEPVAVGDSAVVVEPPRSVASPVISEPATGLNVAQEEIAVREVESELVQVEPATTAIGEDTSGWIRIGPDTLSNRARSGQQAIRDQGPRNAGAAPRKVSRLSELPASVRNDLPKVVFSGHLYSSDPDSSMVFVDNGRPVTQGRQIANELFLYEITPTGVIVEFRGYLIDVGVLQNWTLN